MDYRIKEIYYKILVSGLLQKRYQYSWKKKNN